VLAPGEAWPAVVSAVVLVVFTVTIVATLHRDVACPCFGSTDTPTSGRSVMRNGVLLGLAVLATGPIDGAGGATLVLTAGLATLVGVATWWADRPLKPG